MEPLLEERLHRAGWQVAPPDEPFVSLKVGCGVNRVGGLWLSLRSCPGSGLLRSLSALGGARGRVAAVPASQIVCGPSGGQTNGGACRDRIGRAGGAGLERLLQREDVPGGDEDLASDG